MQWLKKMFFKLRFRIIDNYARRHLSHHNPNRKLCAELLNELRSDAFSAHVYRPNMVLGNTVVSRYSNIESFTQKMKETIRLIQAEKMVPVDWVQSEEATLSLDRFLTSKDGYYLDTEIAVEKFKEVGLKLCEIMEVSDHETVGLPEHNLRMLTKLFINLRDVTTALIAVSLN